MSSIALQINQNPPHTHTNTKKARLHFFSVATNALLQHPKKSPIFIINFTVSPNKLMCFYIFFARIMWAFSAFASVRNFFTEKTGKQRKNLPPHPPYPSLSLSSPPLFSLSFAVLSLSLLSLSFFSFPSFFIACLPIFRIHLYHRIYPFSCFLLFSLFSLSAGKTPHAQICV